MLTEKIILLILLAVSAPTAILFIVLYARARKRYSILQKRIADSLQNGGTIPYSLHDDRLAMLENDVAQLSEQLHFEKDNARALICENNAFLADVSHQLKTPLAGMRLYCEMAQQTADEKTGKCLEKQLELLDRTDKLIFDLLRLEKLRSDGYELLLSDENIGNLCQSVCNELRDIYPHKHFSVLGTATLHCDRQWMFEAISNIVKNACEHTDEQGKIDITVSRGETAVFIYICDNGGGMPEDRKDRLFERFYRGGNTGQGGFGLGLAISRAVTERHHGTLGAENYKDGMRFIMCFPLPDGIYKFKDQQK